MKKLGVLIILVIIVAAALYSYSNRVSDKSVKIGFVGSLSSFAADWGNNARMGAELAIEELKKESKDVELIIEDDASDATQTLSAYSKLINLDQVQGIVGGTWWARNIAEQVTAQNIPLISVETVEDESGTYDAYFIMGGYLKDWAKGYEPIMIEKGVKKIAVIRYISKFGEVLAGEMEQIAKRNGMEIDIYVYNDIALASEANTIAAKINDSGADFIYMDAQPQGYANMLNKLAAYNILDRATFAAQSGIAPVIQDKLIDLEKFDGIYLTQRPNFSESFKEKFRAKFNQDPHFNADMGYFGTLMLYDALAKGGDAITNLKNETFKKDGVTLTFDEINVVQGGVKHLVHQLRDGEIILVE